MVVPYALLDFPYDHKNNSVSR